MSSVTPPCHRGVALHASCRGYLTLYVGRNAAGANGSVDDADDVIVVTVLDLETGSEFRLSCPVHGPHLLRNLYVDEGQTVFGATSRGNRWVVWGVCTSTPLP